ncbi:TPA: lactonase family protein [Vibrio vulnificus]|nr:lactonase family protein [Vibrio vulnificus]
MTQGILHFYVGTYTDEPSMSDGVAQLELNTETGELIPFNELATLRNPSYLTQTSRGLYTFNEVAVEENPQLVQLGCVDSSAMAINGSYPCHLDIDPTQTFCAVANYGSGNTSIYTLDVLGAPSECIAELYVEGDGPNRERQTSPHAHQATFLRHSPFLAVVDLGTDQVHFYQMDGQQQAFTLHQSLKLPAGSGPRHLVFNQAETRAYLLCELTETLLTLERANERWAMVSEQPLLPGEENGAAASAIRLSSDEQFLYASCRRQNKITVFDVSQSEPKWLEAVDSLGDFPRDFVLSRNGKWLLVANQHSHNVASYRRDRHTGRLTATGFSCQIGSPVCLVEHQEPFK